MGVFTSKIEVTTAIPPARMFKAFVFDFDKIISKIASEAILNIELIEGNGASGSIVKITFGEGSQVKYVKIKIEAIDKKGFSVNYSLIERDALRNNLVKISHDIKFIAALDGGSICEISSRKHYTAGDVYIKEEDVKAEKERVLGLLKARG